MRNLPYKSELGAVTFSRAFSEQTTDEDCSDGFDESSIRGFLRTHAINDWAATMVKMER